MTLHDLGRAEEIFEAVVHLPPDERAAALDERCGSDLALRQLVAELLACESQGQTIDGAAARGLIFDDLEGVGDRIGVYSLERVLGEGGMGTVFLAQQKEPIRRKVALKLIKVGMDTRQVVQRFDAERQALALMEHPGIARVFDAGATTRGRPYFVMEWVDGLSITEYCDRRQLSVRDRVDLFIRVSTAVHHAHQKGIVHRDLKPANVLVGEVDGEPVPKVIDFGIAKATQQRLTEQTLFTQLKQVVGTPTYMSPEQAEFADGDIDTRSDIYSLGVLLYELLTGTTPLRVTSLSGSSFDDLRREILTRDAEKPSRRVRRMSDPAERDRVADAHSTSAPLLARTLRGDLDWITMRCLERDRHRRYPTALHLAQDLQRYLRDEPVSAGPPDVGYRLGKFVVRHRAGVTIGTAFVAVLIILTLIFVDSLQTRNREVESALIESRIERGRAATLLGNSRVAEELLWPEYLRRPDRSTSYWALWEYYSQLPCSAQHAIGGKHRVSVVGDRLAALTNEGAVAAFRAGEAEPYAVLETGEAPLTHIAMHPDGGRVATGNVRGVIRVWRLEDGAVEHEMRHPVAVTALAFSPTGETLLSGDSDGSLRWWNTTTGASIGAAEIDDAPTRLAVSGSGRWLAVGSVRGDVHVWSNPVDSGPPVRAWSARGQHSDQVGSLAFDPTEERLVSGSRDRSIIAWDCASGTLLRRALLAKNTVFDLAYSPDGTRLVSIGLTLDFHDVETLEKLRTYGHSGIQVGFLEDGGSLVVASQYRHAVFEAEPQLCLRTVPAHRGAVRGFDIASDGRFVATGGLDRDLHVWDRELTERSFTLTQETGDLRALRIGPRGTALAVATSDGTITLWDLDRRVVRWSATGFTPNGSALEFDRSGDRLFTGGVGRIQVWSVATGEKLAEIDVPGHNAEVLDLCWIEERELLAASVRPNRIAFWSATTLAPIHESTVEGAAFCLASEGSQLLAGCWSGRIFRFDGPTLAPSELPYEHTQPVRDLVFLPRGAVVNCERAVASASGDGTLKLWDLDTNRRLLTLQPSRLSCYGVTYVHSGPLRGGLISWHEDGSIGVWDLNYYDRHIAGNLEFQIEKYRAELGSDFRPELWTRGSGSASPRSRSDTATTK